MQNSNLGLEHQIIALLRSSDRNQAELVNALQLTRDQLLPLLEGLQKTGMIDSYFRSETCNQMGVITYRLIRNGERSLKTTTPNKLPSPPSLVKQ